MYSSCLDYQVAFSLFDHDADGFISTKELRSVLRSLNISLDDKEIKKMIVLVDMDSKFQFMPFACTFAYNGFWLVVRCTSCI